MKNLFLAAAFLIASAGYTVYASNNMSDAASITMHCGKCGKDHDGKKKCCKDKSKCDKKETAHKCDKEKACCAKKEEGKEEIKKDDN